MDKILMQNRHKILKKDDLYINLLIPHKKISIDPPKF